MLFRSEEPPPRVVFVLATTDPQRVLPTILSRCQRFDYRRIPLDALERHLGWIAEQEAIQVTPEALHVVAQRAQGGLRDAESLLDQLSLLPGPVEPMAVWELLGAVPEQELLQLAQALAGSEPLGVIEAIRNLLERGREPGAVLQGMAGLLRDLVLAGVAPDRLELTSFSPQIRGELPTLARSIGKAKLLRWQAQLKGSEQQLRQSVQPRLWLEVLLLGLLAEPAIQASATAPAAPQRTSATVSAAPPTTAAPVTPVPAPDPAPVAAAPPVAAAAPEPATPAPAPSGEAPDLAALWQQILAGLELPSTRMLLSQQASLARLDSQRAVVQVAGNWTAMVQSRLPLLEKAVASALGSPRQVVLEAGNAPAPAAPIAAPAATPAPAEPPAASTPAPAPVQAPAPTAVSAPPAAAPAPPSPPVPAQTAPAVPSPQPQQAPEPEPKPAAEAPAPVRQPHGLIDDQAKRLADFFNGEVVDVQDPLPELGDDQAVA